MEMTLQKRPTAAASARFNSTNFDDDSEPTYCVKDDFPTLTRPSQQIQEECFMPSSTPIETCVLSPSPLVKTGAQMTVENREAMRAGRLTTTYVRKDLGSDAGRCTR